MRAALLCAAALLSGCVAQVVETRRPKPGPVPEVGLLAPGGGRVRYALKGPKWLVARRRKSAFKKMGKVCGGGFQVLAEEEREDAETPYHVEDLDAAALTEAGHYKIEAFRHITFECR